MAVVIHLDLEVACHVAASTIGVIVFVASWTWAARHGWRAVGKENLIIATLIMMVSAASWLSDIMR